MFYRKEQLVPGTFRNPILPGFYPDPSICRVGEDYYLVNSTFEYFPGLPIFHSRDLVHWRQLGHVLDRPSQLPLDGVYASGGLYAPTIRYNEGTFYVINTLVGGTSKKGNFIVTATNPAGPWSELYWLENAPGIDPSLFFDDDSRAWFVGNRTPLRSQYEGHREIWLQELDLQSMRLVGDVHVLWDGALKGAVHAEAPHIYKQEGMYYLMIAEGGTSHNHAVTIARSAKITGPYEGNRRNPIMTHRHLGLDYPIVGTGHADLVETQFGEWWMVLLAMRPYGGYFYNLGRETFLVPVRWEDGWPVVAAGSGRVESVGRAPNLPEHRWPSLPVCDHFETQTLAPQWNFLRTPRDDFWSLSVRPGYLRLQLRPERLTDLANPSFVGRRQQHMRFTARAALEFTPQHDYECAGLVLLQNNEFHFRFVITGGAATTVRLVKRSAPEPNLRFMPMPTGTDVTLAEFPIESNRFYFKVGADGQAYSFYIATEPEAWQPVAEGVDGRILSTPLAGGFVGTYIGMYTSSNGQPSANTADFDWFEYVGLDEI
jgi:xylan 1,4-beta-xylosidase